MTYNTDCKLYSNRDKFQLFCGDVKTSGLSASVAPGRALATLAGRPGQWGGWTSYYLEGEPKKARGQRQGSNSSHPFSPSAHIAPILAPFVIPASLIPVIPATPLISFNLKGDGCSSSIKGQATKIWRENTNIEFRNPVIMNLEPFHQVSGDTSRDSLQAQWHQDKGSVSQKLIYVTVSRTSHMIQWHSDTVTPSEEGGGEWDALGGLICYSDFAQYSDFTWYTVSWYTGHVSQYSGPGGSGGERHLAKSCYSSHWPPSVFGFATNKKLISLQSQENLMRSRAQLVVGEYLLWQMCSIWLWCEVDDH